VVVVVVVDFVVVVLVDVVVLVVLLVVVLVVVVVVGTVTDTRQPIGVTGVIGLEFVSNRLSTLRPRLAELFMLATVLKVTCATLTTPVGPSSRELWSAEIFVEPLVNVPEFVVGVLENSEVLPPVTEAIVTTVGSYVSVIVYAPNGVVPTSKRTSMVNWLPGWEVAGHESVPVAASTRADATRIRMNARVDAKKRSARRRISNDDMSVRDVSRGTFPSPQVQNARGRCRGALPGVKVNVKYVRYPRLESRGASALLRTL
jgi:hypothetical protein